MCEGVGDGVGDLVNDCEAPADHVCDGVIDGVTDGESDDVSEQVPLKDLSPTYWHAPRQGHGCGSCAALPRQTNPAAHRVPLKAVAPGKQAKPGAAPHTAQAAMSVALMALLYVPAGQGTGEEDAMGQKWPAGHARTSALLAPAPEYLPAGAGVHTEAPVPLK